MDDDMPPLISLIGALPIRVGCSPKTVTSSSTQHDMLKDCMGIDGKLLAAYSSSAPPLIEDRSGLLEENNAVLSQTEVQSLQNDLELSLYEYSALEQRYRTLTGQHRDLRKLTQEYDDIIRGASTSEVDAVSIAQLRADAGPQGLRARALEANLLMPVIQEAGGVQALASRMQSVESLIEQAGGLEALQEQFADAFLLRHSLDEVGGLQGLNHLVSQEKLLCSEQQKYAQLRASVDGPDGLRAKALRYDMLQQAFANVQRGAAVKPVQKSTKKASISTIETQASRVHPRAEAIQAFKATVPSYKITPTSEGTAAMNPARAAMLSVAPERRDPNRDLYEASRPQCQSTTKTGSNDVPLGKRRGDWGSCNGPDQTEVGQKRLRIEEEMLSSSSGVKAKRPRFDTGRASVFLQASPQRRESSDPNFGRLQPVRDETDGVYPSV